MLHCIAMHEEDCEDVLPDGIYGTQTASAVSSFQKAHALPVTGVADQNTWDQIVAAYQQTEADSDAAWQVPIEMGPGSVYGKGDNHPYVRLFQSMLQQIAEDCHSITRPDVSGQMDDATSCAVMDFQALCGLPMTGEMDKCTWKNLAIQYASVACSDRE